MSVFCTIPTRREISQAIFGFYRSKYMTMTGKGSVWLGFMAVATIGSLGVGLPAVAQAQTGPPAGKQWFAATNVVHDLATSPNVMRLFRTGTLDAMYRNPKTIDGQPGVLVVNDANVFLSMASSNSIPVGIRGVVYDNQRSPLTPAVQQANPMHYDSEVAQVASAHGLFSMCDFIEPSRLPRSNRAAAYEVPPCSMVGLNAVQQSERSAFAYAKVVKRDAQIVHSVFPGRPVIAGISSNPRGPKVTSSELQQAISAVANEVQGYWLNVPEPSVSCPRCNVPDPTPLAQALS